MPAKMRGLYCTREKWGAVIVNYFQGSDLRLPLGKKRREVWRGMVREDAVKLCRGRGGISYSPLGEVIYTVAFSRGGFGPQNKENLS